MGNRDELDKVVVETLGFNPKEFKYQLDSNTKEIQEIKTLIKQGFPAMGQAMVELNFLKEILDGKGLEVSEEIGQRFEALSQKIHEIAASEDDEESDSVIVPDNLISKGIN